MADRIAVGRIITGHGDSRTVIPAGSRFNTDTLGQTEDQIRELENRGILRKPRDDVRRAPAVAGPGATTDEEVTERRSGEASNVRSPAALAQQEEDNATGDTSGAADTPAAGRRAGRGRSSDLDL